MKNLYLKNHVGMGFVEVMIAVLVVTASAIPIIYMVTSSRTETSRAINYLRAVELANEVIECASAAEFSQVTPTTLSGFRGSISEEFSAGLKTVAVDTVDPENQSWKADSLMAMDLHYSEQYNTAFFFREFELTDINESYLRPGMLKKLTVRVKWSEGERPANLNVPENRTRQVELSVLLLNEKNLQL
ncbi:MAG: hypothetical protein PHD82_07330 [Candidatus Riflebacteria bacterium]|nr:hypothetical protein [Candidatus Riflebacteria bacterium]